jgi:hypothetical protein
LIKLHVSRYGAKHERFWYVEVEGETLEEAASKLEEAVAHIEHKFAVQRS